MRRTLAFCVVVIFTFTYIVGLAFVLSESRNSAVKRGEQQTLTKIISGEYTIHPHRFHIDGDIASWVVVDREGEIIYEIKGDWDE